MMVTFDDDGAVFIHRRLQADGSSVGPYAPAAFADHCNEVEEWNPDNNDDDDDDDDEDDDDNGDEEEDDDDDDDAEEDDNDENDNDGDEDDNEEEEDDDNDNDDDDDDDGAYESSENESSGQADFVVGAASAVPQASRSYAEVAPPRLSPSKFYGTHMLMQYQYHVLAHALCS